MTSLSTPVSDPETPGARTTAAQAWGVVWRAVRFVLARTFADPVRAGRLRDEGWPSGLRATVVVAVVVYGLLMLSAVFASSVRGHDRLLFVPPSTSLPQLAVPLLGTGLVLALACLQTAVLHVRLPVRIATTAVVMATLLNQVRWADLERPDLVVVGFTAVLPLLVVVRARRRFHWLELVVALGAIGGAVLAHQTLGLAELAATAPGTRVTELDLLLIPVWGLAAPVSILAGAALVEITTAVTAWSTTAIWQVARRRPGARRWTTGLLVALVAGRLLQEVLRFSDPTALVSPRELVVAALLLLVVLAGCAAVTTLADATTAGDPRRRPDPDDVVDVWHRTAPFLVIAIGAGIGLQTMVGVLLHGVGLTGAGLAVRRLGGDQSVLVSAVLIAGLAVGAAVVLAVRGWRRAALVLITFALMFGAQSLFSVIDLVTTTEDLLTVASAAAVVVLVVLAVRGRLTTSAEVAIAGVLALGIAYAFRDWFTEPLTQLVSLTGVSAALLVGLVWRLLTDNAFARGDSPGFPRASRVLVALANALGGVVFAALLALRGGQYDLDLQQAESLGDSIVGFPLVLAVMFSGLTLAVHGREVGRDERSP